jgi:tripartite-type tricarboxylate transporter receptor subunit TctC
MQPIMRRAIALAFFCASACFAQPTPVRVIVGFPPGGGTDVVARLVGQRMQEIMAAPVVIENKPGAGGQIAARTFKTSAPDGRTLLATATAPMVAAAIQNLDYDPSNDFVPVSLAATFQLALVVGPATPARSLNEFLAWSRADPKRQSYGTAATGSIPHLLGTLLSREVGIEWVHVPFNGGAPLLNALAGAQIPAGLMLLSEALPLHKEGRLTILATAGTARPILDPRIPTFAELGYPRMVAEGWIAFYAPKGTAPAAIERLSAAVSASVKTPKVAQKLLEAGYEPIGSSGEFLGQRMAADFSKWVPVAKSLGLSN